MSKEAEAIPEDIIRTAADCISHIPETPGNSEWVRAKLIWRIARALHSERKKWEGASEFKRLMEK